MVTFTKITLKTNVLLHVQNISEVRNWSRRFMYMQNEAYTLTFSLFLTLTKNFVDRLPKAFNYYNTSSRANKV